MALLTKFSTGSNAAADAHAELLQGFRVEQVIAPAPVEQRQVTGRRVLRAKRVELEQRLNALLLTLAYGFAQLADCLLLLLGFADHTAPACSAVDQQFGNQACGALLTGEALRLLVGDQPLQLRPGVFQ